MPLRPQVCRNWVFEYSILYIHTHTQLLYFGQCLRVFWRSWPVGALVSVNLNVRGLVTDQPTADGGVASQSGKGFISDRLRYAPQCRKPRVAPHCTTWGNEATLFLTSFVKEQKNT
eukprot:4286494-Amphidinium_carterae.1